MKITSISKLKFRNRYQSFVLRYQRSSISNFINSFGLGFCDSLDKESDRPWNKLWYWSKTFDIEVTSSISKYLRYLWYSVMKLWYQSVWFEILHWSVGFDIEVSAKSLISRTQLRHWSASIQGAIFNSSALLYRSF